jgi:hypothetical protein
MTPPPPPTPAPIVNPMASINPTAATLSMIEAILSMALAVYLLIIGILTLRDSRSGAKLHWGYVALKIPLAILAIVANSWLATSLIAGMNAAAASTTGITPAGAPTAGAGMGAVAIFWVVLLAAAAIAYPLALVPVLLTKTVRKYYSAARYD